MRLTGQRLLDRYLVGRRLARGGMGVVFEGDDQRLRRPVCVKVFVPLDPSRPEYATVLEHFVQEAFTLSRLKHPNTLRIYDFGYLDAVDRTGPFFVTEYADGGTLTDLVVQRGTLAPAEILRILEPIVGALGEAHDAGIIHRDIKPSNILFTRAGGGLMPKLCDFSIAKATGDVPHRAQDTNHHVPLYSLSWAAPEQLAGNAIEPSADVFALGLTTLYMLTGTLVYPSDDIMKGYALRSKGDEYRHELIREAGLSNAVTKLLLHATAEEADDRHATVESFLDALRDAFEDDGGDLELTDSDLTLITDITELPPEVSAALREPADDASPAAPAEVAEVTTLRVVPPEPAAPAPVSRDHSPLPVPPPPIEPPETQPLLEAPPEAAPRPAPPPSRPQRPRLELGSLASEQIVLGNRRVRLVQAGSEPLALTGPSGETARVRITPIVVDRSRLHIKGLNCFVRLEGSRPSSGLDLKHSTNVELVSVTQSVIASLRIALGKQVDQHHVCELTTASVVVPAYLVSWVVVLDLLPGPDAVVLYLPPGGGPR